MKKPYILAVLMIAFSLVLAACTGAPTETPPAYPDPAESTAGNAYPYPYPLPAAEYIPPTRDPSYPAPPPTPTYGITYVVPEVAAGKGVVIGKLVNIDTGEPLVYQKVFLGFKIPLTPGPDYNYGLHEASSPQTFTDDQGRFAIGDVEPGSYIVIAFHPSAISVVMEPNSDQALDVVVSAGQMLDLGQLEVQPPFK